MSQTPEVDATRRQWLAAAAGAAVGGLGALVSQPTGAEAQAVFVDTTSNQTIGGIKTFTSAPVVPNGSLPQSGVDYVAKGDLVAGSGPNAFARMPVGSDGLVLTADSTAATGVRWAVAANAVSSVAGRTGAVVLTAADVAGAARADDPGPAGQTLLGNGPLMLGTPGTTIGKSLRFANPDTTLSSPAYCGITAVSTRFESGAYYDNQIALGWNLEGRLTDQPQMAWTIESRFRTGPSQPFQSEGYLQWIGPGNVNRRPYYAIVDWSSAKVSAAFCGAIAFFDSTAKTLVGYFPDGDGLVQLNGRELSLWSGSTEFKTGSSGLQLIPTAGFPKIMAYDGSVGESAHITFSIAAKQIVVDAQGGFMIRDNNGRCNLNVQSFPGSVGNVGLFNFSTTGFGSALGVLGMANAQQAPTAPPATGGLLFIKNGALMYLGSSGTLTTVGAA